MMRRPLYRERVQFSLRTLFSAMATVPAIVFCGRAVADVPFWGVGSFAIGLAVAVIAFRLLNPDETRTLYLQMLLASLTGIYAFWIPGGYLYYMAGAGVGVVLTWQGPALLTLFCATYGIYRVKVYDKPRWTPSRRDPTWMDSTVV